MSDSDVFYTSFNDRKNSEREFCNNSVIPMPGFSIIIVESFWERDFIKDLRSGSQFLTEVGED